MDIFHYHALNAEGQPVTGEVQAETVQHAIEQLNTRGLIVQSVGVAGPPEKTFEQDVLHAHLRAVLERGRSIIPALRAFAEELPPGRRRRQLVAMIDIFERGDVDEATAAVGEQPDYWLPLLSAATTSNDLEPFLREFVEESQRSDRLRRDWRLALTYPLVLLGLTIAILLVFSYTIVPTFRTIFGDFNISLPPLTMLVLTVAWAVTSGWLLLLTVALFLVGWLLVKLAQLLPEHWRDWWGNRLRLPWQRAIAMARFSRFTADLLEAGLTVPNSLRIAECAAKNPRLGRAACRLASDLKSHADVAGQTYRRSLTATFVHALHSEMSQDARIYLLRELSACHMDRARRKLLWNQYFVGPVAICLVGLLVGTVVIALFLPLISLINSLA